MRQRAEIKTGTGKGKRKVRERKGRERGRGLRKRLRLREIVNGRVGRDNYSLGVRYRQEGEKLQIKQRKTRRTRGGE